MVCFLWIHRMIYDLPWQLLHYAISCHDDVMTWKGFSNFWPFVVRGIHWSIVDSPHKGPVMLSLVSLNKLLSKQLSCQGNPSVNSGSQPKGPLVRKVFRCRNIIMFIMVMPSFIWSNKFSVRSVHESINSDYVSFQKSHKCKHHTNASTLFIIE